MISNNTHNHYSQYSTGIPPAILLLGELPEAERIDHQVFDPPAFLLRRHAPPGGIAATTNCARCDAAGVLMGDAVSTTTDDAKRPDDSGLRFNSSRNRRR